MDFDLDEEQRLLKDSVDRFVERRYGPSARVASAGAVVPHGRGDGGPGRWDEIVALGLPALPFAPGDGGLGGGPVETMIVMEAFGRGLVAEPYLPRVILAGGALRDCPRSPPAQAAIAGILAGTTHVALAHAEPQARHDLADVATEATRRDGRWRLRGTKSLVLDGAAADLLVVGARTADGLALFLVPSGARGVSRHGHPLHDGTRAATITLDDVELDAASLLAAPGEADAVLRGAIDRAIAATCAEAVGAMHALLDLTVTYLKTRMQFGVPIGSFQALQHRAVDMHVELEQARSMAIFAAMSADEPDSARRGAAMSAAKVQVCRSSRFVAQQAVQLHGGMGMTAEYAVGRYARRLLALDTLFGDAAHHLAALTDAGGLEP